jgi:hypothetical protein
MLNSKRIQPKQFLLLLILFASLSVFISKKLFVKAYTLDSAVNQYNDTLQPRLREDEVKAVNNSDGVCGSPVVVYEGTQNCEGGGTVDVNFSENNGGRRNGTVVYSKDLSLKISKITIPLGVLSGTDIGSTNISIDNDNYILPAASSMFTDKHEDVVRAPTTAKVDSVEYETWATVGQVSFSELDEPSQESEVVVDEYVPSNTEECATCSTNPDKSEKIGEVVNNRTLPPGHSENIEANLPVLMCKDENSISVTPQGVGCIDEGYSILKRVTAVFSGSDWEQCNAIEYDEEGNIISDGRCIDIENVELDLSGIFQNTNTAYKKVVDAQMYPGSGYNCELSLSFPAWVEIDGKGIYEVSAKINVPYECWRKSQEFDDTDSETPSDRGLKAFIEYIEDLNRDSINF